MADRLDRVNQGLSRENSRLKSQFKSQEDDRKFLIKQLVAMKVDTAKNTLGNTPPQRISQDDFLPS